MTFAEFIRSINKDQRKALAQRCGTTEAYFYQIAGGHRKPSAMLAKKIAKEANLDPAVLLPEIFGDGQ